MITPRIAKAGASAAVCWALLLGGCKSASSQGPSARTAVGTTRPSNPSAPPGPAAAPDTSEPASPGLLARKSESYSQELAALLERRKARREPSQVEWPDTTTDPSRSHSAKSESANQAVVTPAVDIKPAIPAQELEKRTHIPPQSPPDTAQPANAALSVSSVSPIRPAPDGAPPVVLAPAAPPAAIARPPAPAPSSPAAASTDALEQKLAQRAKDYPRDIAAHLDYQLLRFLKDEQVPVLSAIAALPSEDRELLSSVLDGISNFRNTLRADNNTLLSRKVRPLLDLSDRLRSQADLAIPTIALCTRVDKFGVYDTIEPARFPANAKNDVVVYCEIENVASQLNDKKQWESKLTEEVVLYTETGMPVLMDKASTIQDLSRARRHDFFIAKKISLPPTLVIGRYLLKVSIVDQQASRVAEATMPLVIMAK